MAKPLANGYPIGAILMKDVIASAMSAGAYRSECWYATKMMKSDTGAHGTTFGGSPLACAIGHHVLNRLSEPSFSVRMKETSGYLRERLELLPRWFPEILQDKIRGRGLILGLGFKNTQDPGRVVGLARERGLFVLTAGNNVVRLVPSLTVGKEEIDMAVDVLEGSLAAMLPA